MRTRLVLATAAAVLAVASPAASAAEPLYGLGKEIAYAVQLDGEGSYKYEERTGAPESWSGHQSGLNFEYHGTIGDGVVFRNASPLDTTGDDLGDGFAAGGYQATGAGGDGMFCESTNEDPTRGRMRFLDDSDVNGGIVPLDGNLHLWLRPFEQYNVSFTCPEDTHPVVWLVDYTNVQANADGTLPLGKNPFDIEFELPRDIIGMGYVEQVIPTTVREGRACPGWIDDQTIECRLEWHATIKLTKLWERPVEATSSPSPPVPQPPAPPAPAPKPSAPGDPDDDLLLPLVPQGKASMSASKATFSVSCAAGCSGTASLTAAAPGSTARAAAGSGVLARARFAVPKGGTRRVTVKLGARARRAVRKAGGVRIAVRIVSGGRATLTTLKLRLRR
jgi:hypothetical protein